MNAELLLAHYDRISDAPDAVARLRKFVLDLAVRGKLVEPTQGRLFVSKLIREIKKETAERAEHGAKSPQLQFQEIAREDAPFRVPPSWTWIRFGCLVIGADAGWSPKAENFPRVGENWGVLKVSAVSWNRFLPSENKQLLPGIAPPEAAQVHKGDFLISRANTSELVAKSVVVEIEPKNLILSDKIVRLKISRSCNMKFLNMVNNHAGYARAYYAEEASGTSLSMKNVSRSVIYNLMVPLPSMEEQDRIIAKVDELMALCDRLEAAQREQETRREQLTASAHHHLNNGEDAEELRTHIQFFIGHLPRLTKRPDQIKQLRQTILNLAVRGKLLPQDPNDESARIQLKRIQDEKLRMFKDGIIRKEHPVSAIAKDQAPFTIPDSWEWIRIGAASLFTDYGTSVKSDHAENGVPVLKMGDIQEGKVLLGGQKKVSSQIDDLPQLFLKRFDLLYNRTNSAELVGKTGIYMGDDDSYTFASYLIRIRFQNELTNAVFINLAMNAQYFRTTQILPELQQQCGQANVNGTKLRSMLVPLAPLAEQHRIVAKVSELMALCDQSEASLTTAQTETSRLLESVLHAALNGDHRRIDQG
jgi:type I restriction enzyme S subunit